MKALPRMRGQIRLFINLTHKNIYDQQASARFQKWQESTISLHPNAPRLDLYRRLKYLKTVNNK